MQRTILVLCILSLALTGCCGFRSPLAQYPYKCYFKKPTEEALDVINRQGIVDVVFGWGATLHYETGIYMCNSCAVFDTKIKMIRMEFVCQNLYDLMQARKQLVYIVEGLLKRVNGYIGLEGSMAVRPFTPEQVEIVITFESFDGLFIDPKYNGRTTLLGGISSFAEFAVYDYEEYTFGCKKEPYYLTKELVEIEERVKAPYIRDAERLLDLAEPRFRERYTPHVIPAYLFPVR